MVQNYVFISIRRPKDLICFTKIRNEMQNDQTFPLFSLMPGHRQFFRCGGVGRMFRGIAGPCAPFGKALKRTGASVRLSGRFRPCGGRGAYIRGMDFPKHPVERPFRPVDFRFRPIGFSIQGRFPSQKRARFVSYSSKKAPSAALLRGLGSSCLIVRWFCFSLISVRRSGRAEISHAPC